MPESVITIIGCRVVMTLSKELHVKEKQGIKRYSTILYKIEIKIKIFFLKFTP